LRDVLLEDLAYTLQVGREAHEERLAFAVATHQDLCDKLGAWLAGATDVEELYQGRAGAHNDGLALFAIDEELHEAVDKWLQRGKHRRLLALWAKGVQIDWRKLYADGTPQRVSLPTYPYARQRCWLPQAAGAPVDVATGLRAAAPVAETPGARGAGPGAAPDPYAGLPTLETLLAATGPTASRCVMQGLAKLIARVRKLDPAVMADEDTYADQPISSFGIDSVGAMEVRSAIRPWLGVDVPSHLLIGAHPMREVAATLHDKLLLQHLSGAATGAVTDVTALDEEVLVL
jgi:acyl carrier protein